MPTSIYQCKPPWLDQSTRWSLPSAPVPDCCFSAASTQNPSPLYYFHPLLFLVASNPELSQERANGLGLILAAKGNMQEIHKLLDGARRSLFLQQLVGDSKSKIRLNL